MKIKGEGGRQSICLNALFGYVVQWQMVFGAVIILVGLVWGQVEPKLVLVCAAVNSPEFHIYGLEMSLYNGLVG